MKSSSKQKYKCPNENDPYGNDRMSPVFKTLDQKTDEFLERKRSLVGKHLDEVNKVLPLQARIQGWETGLRK
jgi:hypothetical protein